MHRPTPLIAWTLAVALLSPAAADAAKVKASPERDGPRSEAVAKHTVRSDTPPANTAGALAALDEAAVRSRLGPPDVARTEGLGALWTYQQPDCALIVFFRAGPGQPLRVSGAEAGPRQRGQASPTSAACIAEALRAHAATAADPG